MANEETAEMAPTIPKNSPTLRLADFFRNPALSTLGPAIGASAYPSRHPTPLTGRASSSTHGGDK